MATLNKAQQKAVNTLKDLLTGVTCVLPKQVAVISQDPITGSFQVVLSYDDVDHPCASFWVRKNGSVGTMSGYRVLNAGAKLPKAKMATIQQIFFWRQDAC